MISRFEGLCDLALRGRVEEERTRNDKSASGSEVFTVLQVYRRRAGVKTRISVHLGVASTIGLTVPEGVS